MRTPAELMIAWRDAATAPFAQQAALIDRAVRQGMGLSTLVALTAAERDQQPFARLLSGLLEGGQIHDPTVRSAVGEALPRLSAAGLARALGPGSLAGDREARAALARLLVRTLRGLAVDRVASSCVILRWLGRQAPSVLDHLRQDAIEAARAALGEGVPERLEDATLLRIPGRELANLDALAHRREVERAWLGHRAAFARRVLSVLAEQPKPLSLARAEELLSRRVYTEAGHFLSELLQNADDARASTWRVEITADALLVWHDGEPFDARDVVGVLSIGQTTKTDDHIGLFGVGFKSVYAVCERPQVYSDVYGFEIADVSIPRGLAGRPAGAPQDGTLLVLPLRRPEDAEMGAAAIAARARALSAHVLLTLRNVQVIEVLHAGTRRRMVRRPGVDPDQVLLDDGGRTRRYLLASLREPGGAPDAEVTVAVALDAQGRPRAWPVDRANVFSFLPTRQRSGLDFMVQAHFAVPVDRERILLEHRGNQAALARAGELFADLVRRRVAADRDVLPLMVLAPRVETATHPAWMRLAEAFQEAVADVPWLRDAGGDAVRVSEAILVEDLPLAHALDAAPHIRAVPPLPGRLRAVAVGLGARVLVPALLESLLIEALAGHTAGARGPRWLNDALPPLLRFVSREGWPAETIAGLALLPDESGGLHTTTGVRRAQPELRALASPLRALLDPRLDGDPELARLWPRLGVRALTEGEVLADLQADGPAISRRAGAGRVLRWLASRRSTELATLSTVALCPDERGALRPARGPEAVGLAPEGPLGGWLRGVGERPPLADAQVQRRHGDVLRRLGMVELDLATVYGQVAAGAIELSAIDLDRLHATLAEVHLDLSGRDLQATATAAVFPTDGGGLRALVGEGRAVVPAEPALRDLLPDVPWLRADLAGMAHVARLPVAAFDADQLAQALAGRPPPEAPGLTVPDVPAALAFVAARAERIRRPTREALAAAPIWPTQVGPPRPLAALRAAAPEPVVAAVYAAWGAWPLAAADAAPLARALGLDDTLRPPDLTRLVADLGAGELNRVQAIPREVLFPALAAAGDALPPSRLAPIARLPLFPTVDDERAPLGHWDAPDSGGAHRTPEALAEALEYTGRRRLAPEAEAALLPLLEALRLRAARLDDLLDQVRHGALARPAAIDAVRATLVRLGADLPTDVALDALPIWPTAAGTYAAAEGLIRTAQLASSGFEGVVDVLPQARLDPSAAADADALAKAVAFRSPVTLLVERLEAEARPGEPLDAQPPWLTSVAQVGRLLAAVVAVPDVDVARLPLVVDAAGRLGVGARMEATWDELAILARLPIAARLADPRWAALARDAAPDLVPRLGVRSWLEALAEAFAEPAELEGHPILSDLEVRAATYRALLARADRISADEPARAGLGRASILPTADGMLRAPRSLLFDPGLPELDLSWNPTDEVPEALRTWLRGLFTLEKRRLRTLVEHVELGHHEAVRQDDAARSVALLGFLARALRIEPERANANAETAQRLKLGKRVRFRAGAGGWYRARDLLVPPDPELPERLAAFLGAPPFSLDPAYDAATGALALAAGGRTDLDQTTLIGLLDNGVGDARSVRMAWARYLLDRVVEQPALVERLSLRQRAWLPDVEGDLQAPEALYWPTPAVVALLGERGTLYPAAALRAGISEATWRRLGCHGANDARLDDVLAQVPVGSVLDAVVLRWLEDQLEAKRIEPMALRAALGDRPLFLSDDERHHPMGTLIRDLPPGEFGRRRGGWSVGRTLPRLTAALRLPIGPAPKHYLSLLEEVGTAFIAQADGLLAAEPELSEVVPRAWVRLVEADTVPERAVVIAETPEGLRPCWSTDPSLVWPEPPGLVTAARAAGVPLRTVHVGEADRALSWQGLAARGVPRADALWRPRGEPLVMHLRDGLHPLTEAVAALWTVAQELRAWPAPWRAEFGPVPVVQLAGRIAREGTILGQPVTWPVRAVVRGSVLALHADHPVDGVSVAEALCWDRLADGVPRADQVRLLTDLLACGNARAMTLLLAARGPDPLTTRPDHPAVQPQPRLTIPGMPNPPTAPTRTGLFSRLKRWLATEDEPSPPPAPRPPEVPSEPAAAQPPPPPPRTMAGAGGPARASSRAFAASHDRFFRPQDSVGTQLDDGRDWLADRAQPAVYGFATAPRRLPSPYLYGPNLIADHFDRRTQHWTDEAVSPEWGAAPRDAGHRVTLAGRLPAGESVLPVPLYGRLLSVDADPPALVIRSAGGLPLVSTSADTSLRCEIVLGQAPDFSTATPCSAPEALMRPTVPDVELPAECHALVDRVIGLGPFERALAIRDFIRASYRYDPTRFEDPRLAGWLRRVSRGRANAQLAALHAGRDATHLGAGVCYELNVLAVELLRRAGVPAAVATGWVFDRGQVDEADHLWAMALLGTEDGPRWMPVDASTTRDGRPLRVRPRAHARWRAALPDRAPKAPRPAAWTTRAGKISREAPMPLADLIRVARHVGALSGADLPDEAALRARCRDLLADPRSAAQLAALLRED